MQPYVQTGLEAIRIVHILAGATALFSGILALGLFKQSKRHRLFGKFFFNAMIVVFFTAVVLAGVQGLNFLLCIAFLSFYSAYRGVRAMLILKGSHAKWYDQLAGSSVVLCGAYLVLIAISAYSEGEGDAAIIFGAFGILSIYLALSSMREYVNIPTGAVRWFRIHKSSMGGALIATMTAFTVTALQFLPDLVAWLGPTIVFSPVLALIIRRSERDGMKA
ncbi:MAG: hypothetical protein RLP15_03095 [Cryomorphaceae bacterium]